METCSFCHFQRTLAERISFLPELPKILQMGCRLDSQKRRSLRWKDMAERIGGVYLPRNPKASPLFGLVEDYFDEFVKVYEERFAEKHGLWRPVIRQVVDRFIDCGDLRPDSPVFAAKTRISFIEDPSVIRRILQHLGVWSTQERPPPFKPSSFFTEKPIPDALLPWAAETIYFYDDVDPTYED